jgi:transposase
VEPGRADDQAASGLRRARAAAVGSRDPRPAPREHSTRGGTRRHQGGAPGGFPRAAAKRPERLIADRGCSFPRCRRLLRRRGIPHTIPERRDQRERRAGYPGRPPGFDSVVYRRRNVVERCVNRLKQWRGIATRYEKRAVNYQAMLVIASLMVWLAS